MHYDYSALCGKIVEKFQNRKNFATALGITPESLGKKLNSARDFKQSEIESAVRLLEIRADDIGKYFFTLKVQNN